MGFWDDVWGGAEKVVDKVGDVFTGDDAPKAKPIAYTRPEFSGKFDWTRINAGYQPQENPYEKRTWLTGADQNSLTNGWSNDFMKRSLDQQQKLTDEGKLGTWYKEKDATGVMLWDADDDETGKSYKFGDVFDKGKYVGNLYEHGGDETVADLMMSQLTLSKEAQHHVAGQRDPKAALREELDSFRQRTTSDIKAAMGVQEQQAKVDETQEGIMGALGGWGDDLSAFGTGFTGGAATGAGWGAKTRNPYGLAIGAIGGGLLGGASAWLNRDDLSEQMASAYEIAKIAYDEDQGGSAVRGTVTGMGQAAGIVGRSITPLSNLVRGAADEDRGDGVGAFQQKDVPSWAKPLDIAAGIVDSGATFASSPARLMFLGQMGAHTTSKVGELTIGGGMQWDPRTGSYRNVYTDDDASGAAAWGSAAIDAMQTGMAGGLARRAGGARTVDDATLLDKLLLGQAARTSGAKVEQVGGRRFLKDAEDNVVGSRFAGASLIPSEAVKNLASGGAGRRIAARDGLTKQDALYQAATALERKEQPFKAALVNAVAEGTEEGVQEVIDAMSMGHRATFEEITEAYAYGAATGLGMSLGTNMSSYSKKDAQLDEWAGSGFEQVHGRRPEKGELPDLRKQDPSAYRKLVQAHFSKEETKALKQHAKATAQLMAAESGSDVVVTAWTAAAIDKQQETKTKKAGLPGQIVNRLFAAFLAPMSVRDAAGNVDLNSAEAIGFIPDDAVGTHHVTLLNYYKNARNETPQFQKVLEKKLADLTTNGEADGPPIDGAPYSSLREQIQANQTRWSEMDEQFDYLIKQLTAFEQRANQLRRAKDFDGLRTEFGKITRVLSAAYQGHQHNGDPNVPMPTGIGNRALRQAAAVTLIRSPISSVGTYTAYAPALHWEAVRDDKQGAVLENMTSQKKRESDYDGDRSTFEIAVRYDDYAFERAATGINLLVPIETTDADGNLVQAASLKVGSTEHDEALGVAMARAYEGTQAPELADQTRQAVVANLTRFAGVLKTRYSLTAKVEAELTYMLLSVFAGPGEAGPADPRLDERVKLVQAVLDGDLGTDKPIEAVGAVLANHREVFDAMAVAMQNNGRNEVETVLTVFRANMYDLREELNGLSRSIYQPKQGPQGPTHSAPEPRQLSSIRFIENTSAGNLFHTIVALTGSDSLLRIGGAIRYQPNSYKDISAREADGGRDFWFQRAGELLHQISNTTLTQPGDPGPDTFDVMSRVILMARSMLASAPGENTEEAMDFQVWKLLTGEVPDRQGFGKITVAQMLTDQIIQQIRREAPDAVLADPDKQAKLIYLEKAARDARSGDAKRRTSGANQLLRETVGGLRLADLIPPDVGDLRQLDRYGTIDQNIRILWGLDHRVANEAAQVLKNTPAYAHSEQTREVLDFVFNTARMELSFNPDGTPTGVKADKNDEASDALRALRKDLASALREFRRGKGDPTTEHLQQLLLENPTVATKVYDALMHQMGVAGVEIDADRVPRLRKWVLESLIEPNHDVAEMTFWRGRLLSSDLFFRADGKTDSKTNSKVTPKDTLVELLHHLRSNNDLFLLEQVLAKFHDPKMTRPEFEKWVAASVPNKPNPILMYESDPATFSAEQANGGWGSLGDSLHSKLREARTAVEKLPVTVQNQLNVREENRRVARETAAEIRAGAGGQREKNAEVLFAGIGITPVTLTPNATARMMSRMFGLGKDIHVKAGSFEHMRAFAQTAIASVMKNGFLDTVNTMTNLILGTVNVVDVHNNPALIFSARTLRGENGEMVDLSVLRDSNGDLTVLSVLDAIAREDISDLVVEAILPRVYSYDPQTDSLSLGYSGPTTLKQALDNPYEEAFESSGENGEYTLDADWEFGLAVSAAAQRENPTDTNPFEREVLKMVQARMSAAQTPEISEAERAQHVMDAWRDLARAIRFTAQMQADQHMTPGEFSLRFKTVLNKQRSAGAEKINDRLRQRGLRITPTREITEVQEETYELVGKILEHLEDAAARDLFTDALKLATNRNTLDPEDADKLRDKLRSLANIFGKDGQRVLNAIQAVIDGDVFGQLKARYLITAADAPSSTIQKADVQAYLEAHPGLDVRLAEPERGTLLDFQMGHEPSNKQWELLSKVVIAHALEDAVLPAVPTTSKLVLPDDLEKDAWAFDPTWGETIRFLGDSNSPLMRSASLMVAQSRDKSSPSLDRWERSLLELYKPEKAPMWTPTFAAAAKAIDGAFPSASGGYAIAAPGQLSKTQAAMATAARQTWDEPPTEYLQTVRLVKLADGLRVVDAPADLAYFDPVELQGAFGLPPIDAITGDPAGTPTVRVQDTDTGPYELFNVAEIERSMSLGQQLEIQFFSPNHRPAGWEWQNNAFFDGLVAPPTGYMAKFDNLIGHMFFAEDGANNLEQRGVIDSVKKKTASAVPVKADKLIPDLKVDPDPTETLHKMAHAFVTNELAIGTLGTFSYKAALKHLKMHMLVQVTVQRAADPDGTVHPPQDQTVSIDEYLSLLRMDPQVQIVEAELIAMDHRTANTFYGESGSQGLDVGRVSEGNFGREGIFDPTRLSVRQKALLANLPKQVPLGSTVIANRNLLRRANKSVDVEMEAALRGIAKFTEARKAQSEQLHHRAVLESKSLVNFSQTRVDAMSSALRLEGDAVRASAISQADSEGMTEVLADPRMWGGATHSVDLSMGIVLSASNDPTYTGGRVNVHNLKEFIRVIGATFGDSVVLDLASFETDQHSRPEDVAKLLTYFLQQQTEVKVVGGSPTLRAKIKAQLKSQNYSKVDGERDVWVPPASKAQLQLERAYESRLQAQGEMAAKARALTLYIEPGQIPELANVTENNTLVLVDDTRRVIHDGTMVKIGPSAVRHFIHDTDVEVVNALLDRQVDRGWGEVIEKTAKKGDLFVSTKDAIADLMDRRHNGMLNFFKPGGEIIGPGQLTVHVINLASRRNGDAAAIYLHREGSEYLNDTEIEERYKAGERIIIGPAESTGLQSYHPGTIKDILPTSSNSTVRLEVETRVSNVYRKWITGFGEGAMKHLTEEAPDNVRELFEDPLLKGNDRTKIVVISSIGDVTKKLNLLHSAQSFREMSAIAGIDLRPLYYEGMFGEIYPGDDSASDTQKTQMRLLRDFLMSVEGSRDPTTAHREIDQLATGVMRYHLQEQGLESWMENAIAPQIQELLNDDAPTPARIALLSALNYLTTTNSTFLDIEGVSGFGDPDSMAEYMGSHRMPDMLAQLFDKHPQLRNWAAQQMQAQLGDGWTINPLNWQITRHVTINGQQYNIDATLAYPVYADTGEGTEPGYNPSADRPLSLHELGFAESLGGVTWGHKLNSESFRQSLRMQSMSADGLTGYEGIEYRPAREGKPGTDVKPWTNLLQLADQLFRKTAHNKLTPYFVGLGLDQNYQDADPVTIAEIRALIKELANTLFLNPDGREEHYIEWLVRLRTGRPAATAEGQTDVIPLDRIKKALQATKEAVDAGRGPLYRGVVNMVPPEIAMAIYRNFEADPLSAWSPRLYSKKRISNERAASWDDFVRSFLSDSIADTYALHNPAIDQILDAIMHQYQSELMDTSRMPVSLRAMDDLLLLSKNAEYEKARADLLEQERAYAAGETDVMPVSLHEYLQKNPEMRHVSVSKLTRLELMDKARLDENSTLTLQQWIGDETTQHLFNPDPITEEERAYAESRWNSWHKRNRVPYSTRKAMAAAYAHGVERTDSDPGQHVSIRTMLSIRYFLALLNPALAVAGGVEAIWKGSIQNTRKVITGESTGLVGRQVIRVMENVLAQDNVFGVMARSTGFILPYTSEQAARRNEIVSTSGTLSTLRAIIHEDLGDYGANLDKLQQGVPVIVRKLSKFASGMQDLARGTKSKRLIGVYIDAIVSQLHAEGMGVDLILERLAENPVWVSKQKPRVHAAALEAMQDIRGVQQTVVNKTLEAFYTPATKSGNAGVNALSNLFLRMPLMFSRYAANFALTATGLRGVDQLAAHALQGRENPTHLFARLRGKVEGRPDEDNVLKMDDVIGHLDAMDSVINMGVTHSQLFLAGSILQGLGLSGEDEEERRRRRAAQAQGAVMMLDPTQLENDFRNFSAISLDFLPGPLKQIFATTDDEGNKQAIVDLHWTMKQVLMPMLGMERFFETGDFRQVWWGFTEAIGSMPLINTMMLDRTLNMAAELTKAAEDASANGGAEALPETFGFMSSVVAYFEGALMESSFLNSIYVGLDPFDRNPYIHPMRDSDGDLQRDVEGTVRDMADANMKSDGLDGRGIGLQTFINAEGEVKQGYLKPQGALTQMRVLSENRLTFALLSSVFTKAMGQGSNLRYSMPVVERKFDKPIRSAAEQQAIVLAALRTDEGFMKMISAGAAEGATEQQQAVTALAMQFLEEKFEGLGEESAYAMYQAIVDGTMPVGSEALAGAYVDPETRGKIQARWLEDLTQEAVDLGLSEYTAKQLAGKAWYGPDDKSAPGISQILWSDEIPYDKVVRYQQLNTSYEAGVDGSYWAKGFKRPGVLGAFGLAPIQRALNSGDTGVAQDSKLNTADSILGINTGLRGLRRTNDSWDVPTDAEIGDSITKAIEDLNGKSFTPNRGGGYGRRGGGGGGGGYAQRPNLPYGQTPRLNIPRLEAQMLQGSYHRDVRVNNTDNPLLRRDEIQRQRFSSERGRLKSWQ